MLLEARDRAVLVKERELCGGAAMTTNNRMELTAAIEALRTLTMPTAVTMRTDSKYVKNGITSWIRKWKSNGWRTAGNSPVKNVDLWKQLDELQRTHEVQWDWVKGHAGNPGNERADLLARNGMKPFSERKRG